MGKITHLIALMTIIVGCCIFSMGFFYRDMFDLVAGFGIIIVNLLVFILDAVEQSKVIITLENKEK